jgi:hypothetical protein
MSLYQNALASFDMTGYNAQDSAGFIRLFGLPLATAARRAKSAEVAAEAAEAAAFADLDAAVIIKDTDDTDAKPAGNGAPAAKPQVQGIKHAW